MTTPLPAARDRCPRCGAEQDPTRAGPCPRCLIAYALEPGEANEKDTYSAANAPPLRIGGYQLLGEIARGGAGIVHRAWQPELKREVALKMLLSARLESREALDRFRRETELMASLDHPGILPVYEVGTRDGVPWFSMKLAECGNLAERASSLRGRYDEIARLLAQVARAVQHAHSRGVLHRDLKPSNIVFDSDGHALVTDFGLARRLSVDSTLTGVDALIGTPRYIAPETITTPGAKLTAAVDIYGLGAILYELLTGSPPFSELEPLQVLQRVATLRPKRPRGVDAKIPPELETICLRCLEKRPKDRYPSAQALADALEGWLARAGSSVFARIRALGIGVPSRRRRSGVTVGLLLVAALVAAAAWLVLREPIPVPDPAIATRTVAVLPINPQKATPAEREAARQLATHLQLPSALHLLPFEATLKTAESKDFPSQDFPSLVVDGGAVLGAFIRVDVVAVANTNQFAIRARDLLREERLYESSFALSEVDDAARKLAEALMERRRQPTPEARLPRSTLALLLRAERLIAVQVDEDNGATIAVLKDAVARSPDSALMRAFLARAYNWRSEEQYVLDSVIDEAARAESLDPNLGLAPRLMGAAYFAKGWLTRASIAYEKARELGSVNLEWPLATLYYVGGRFDESYRMCRQQLRFTPDDAPAQLLLAHALFTLGENDAGERAMDIAMGLYAWTPEFRTMQQAEVALYRGDFARCREIASNVESETGDGYFTHSSLIRTCAIQQGDFDAALATMEATKRVYTSGVGMHNNDNPALTEAILLLRLNRHENVPVLLKTARQSFQAAIDANDESPWGRLHMAATQRLSGEIDAAYATLEQAFALGLTIDSSHQSDLELLPFLGDARFEALRAKSAANIAAQREKVVAQLDPAMREPIAIGSSVAGESSAHPR